MEKKYKHNRYVFDTGKIGIMKPGTFSRKLFVKLTEGYLDPIISCTQILKYEPENRTNEDLEKTFPWLMKMKELYDFLKLKEDPNDYKNILLEFAFILFNTFAAENSIIKRIGEKKNHFFLVMSGSVKAFELLFKRYNLTEEDFLLHVLKLKILHETEMMNQCIKSNIKLCNINKDIEDYLKDSPKYDYQLMLLKVKKMLSKIGLTNLKKTEKYVKDIPTYLKATSVNTALDVEENKEEKSKINKTFLIPYYIEVGSYKEGTMFGNMLLNDLNSVDDYTIISTDISDIGVIDKSLYHKGNIFPIIKNKMKRVLDDIQSKFYVFQTIESSAFITREYFTLFTYKKYKKGDILFRQNAISKGIFLVAKGNFELYCHHSFDELDSFDMLLQFSLDKFFEYIPSIKKESENMDNLLTMISDPIYKTKEFLKISKESNKILIDYIKPGDVLGLYEDFDYKTNIFHFTAECCSENAIVYYLSKEAFSYLCDKEPGIISNIQKIVENKISLYSYTIKSFKEKQLKIISNVVRNNQIKSIPKIKPRLMVHNEMFHSTKALPYLTKYNLNTEKSNESKEHCKLLSCSTLMSNKTRETDFSTNFMQTLDKRTFSLKRKKIKLPSNICSYTTKNNFNFFDQIETNSKNVLVFPQKFQGKFIS